MLASENPPVSVPLLPCMSLDQTLDFYRALGFEVTHQQKAPYLYAAVQRGAIELHFASLRVYGPKNAFGAYLVFVDRVAPYYRAFADGLRSRYSTIPTAGLPRITRLRRRQTRFSVFDPTGNVATYIERDEPEVDYNQSSDHLSELAQAILNATFLRDTYANDDAAARVLDVALAQQRSADPIDRAHALAMRAELAVAMDDPERARSIQTELQQIALSADDRQRLRHELHAADDLQRWRTQQDTDRSPAHHSDS